MKNMKYLLIAILILDLFIAGCQIAMWLIERKKK